MMMMMPWKKQVILLLLIVGSISMFRRLVESYMVRVTKSVPLLHISLPMPASHGSNLPSAMSSREMQFLQEFFTPRVPCNLLIFGSADQYSTIASLNSRGTTIFLEDDSTVSNLRNRYRIVYTTRAAEAYQLLREARESQDCFQMHKNVSGCKLALSNLPPDVYDTPWDVIVVDGPRGDSADSPGRMASIYMAGFLARRGKGSHAIVHDVDRMIERWFSWEFLCESNLISCKERFWHFYIPAAANGRKKGFCMY